MGWTGSVRLDFSRVARVTVAAGRGGGESGSTSGSTTTGGTGPTMGSTVDVDLTDESDLKAVGTIAWGFMEKSDFDALALVPRGA